jgi:hypothetical protein
MTMSEGDYRGTSTGPQNGPSKLCRDLSWIDSRNSRLFHQCALLIDLEERICQ